jgi:hypothetical protein
MYETTLPSRSSAAVTTRVLNQPETSTPINDGSQMARIKGPSVGKFSLPSTWKPYSTRNADAVRTHGALYSTSLIEEVSESLLDTS